MIHKAMVIATAAGAAVMIAVFSNPAPQAQGTNQANVALTEPRALMPGEVMPPENIEFIENPGRYGLGSDLRGSRYAIVDGHLVRIDPQTMELQSILRKHGLALD